VRLHVVVGGLETTPNFAEHLDFAEHLGHALEAYDDGRRLFSVELIQDGIGRLVANAIHRSVDGELRAAYGNDMVVTGPGRSTSRASLEADQICHDLHIGLNYEPALVGVEVDPPTVYDVLRYKVLSRTDRNTDGTPGKYTASSKEFGSYQDALAYAEGVSFSRGPIVVEAFRASLVLSALNTERV
jgi:hypothetical protein